MELDNLIRFTVQGMLLCLSVSLPPVIVSAVAGLVVSFIQAVTSLQEQTLPHAVKLVSVTVTIIVIAPICCTSIVSFAQNIFRVALPQ